MCPPDRVAVHAADIADAGEAPSPGLIADLVAANHILFDQGVIEAFGHISARHDKRPTASCWPATWRRARWRRRTLWSSTSMAIRSMPAAARSESAKRRAA